MEKQVKLFLEFLQNDKKVSDNTLQSYRRDIVYFTKYVEEGNMNYAKLNEEDIKDYLQHLQEVGKKSSTVSRHLASIRSFYQFLVKNKKVKVDPTTKS